MLNNKINNTIIFVLIIKNLKINNLIDNNSIEELVVVIDLERVFMGQDLPFESMKSDTIGSPRLGYDIKIVKDKKVLRSLVRTNLIYDAGFFKNIKHISMMDKENERENGAIEALDSPKKLKEQFQVNSMNDVFLKLARNIE